MTEDGEILRCGEIGADALRPLLDRYGLELVWIDDGAPIPGSYWGDSEAGLQERRVFVRRDTPVHSVLHEAGHAICMNEARRRVLDTEAGGDDAEENAVCYLQIVLAEHLGMGSGSLMDDMDRWGYSFRLGSTRAWFEEDAADARGWLVERGLLTSVGEPTWRLFS